MREAIVLSRFHTRVVLRGTRFIWFGCLLPVLTFGIMSFLVKGTDYMPRGISVANFLMPGHLLIVVVYTINFVLGYNYFKYREEGTFTQYQLIGVSRHNILWSLWVTAGVFQLASLSLLVFISFLFQGATLAIDKVPHLLMGLGMVNIYEFTLTYLLVVISEKFETYRTAALTVFVIQLLFGGLAIPPELLTDAVAQIVPFLNPVYYALMYIREIWWEQGTFLSSYEWLGVLLIVSVILFFSALYIEKRTCRKVA